MKVVVNRCFGGFSVSERAAREMRCSHEKQPWDGYGYGHDTPFKHELELELEQLRTCPELIRVVELLDEAANGRHAELEVVEIPDNVDWYIHEYDGSETIREKHRSW